jgi:23S rRNA (cytidine2498-2'-O)-methyltransferase
MPEDRPFVGQWSDFSGRPMMAFLAPPGYLAELIHELGDSVLGCHGRLVLAEAPSIPPAWAQNVWKAPRLFTVSSISDAARQLRAMQRNWAACPVHLHRRTALVSQQLPTVAAKPLKFPSSPPVSPLGSWSFLSKDTILASAECTSPFPNGEIRFLEDHVNPPSRAYLKLWEALTRIGRRPGPGDRCLDLGASPGGWTWVLHELGADVIAVDKADLDPRLEGLARISRRKESAFALDPADVGDVDWLFSDIICYPGRLADLLGRFLAAGTVRNFVCTVKFQGPTDFEVMSRFLAVPGSSLMHLFHNRHELTWVVLDIHEKQEQRDAAH